MTPNNKTPKNLEDFLRSIIEAKISKEPIKMAHPVTCEQLAAEGDLLLEKENLEFAKKEIKKSVTKENKNPTNNPYFKARIKILMNYPEWRRNEISEMEKKGDLNNKHYLDFVKEVSIEGDRFSV